MERLKRQRVEKYSGVKQHIVLGKISPLRTGYYRKLAEKISGDAPKDFIQAYEYGTGRKENPKSWPKFIAKVGHKWYPIESITEYLLNQIGEALGLKMAVSKLCMSHGQLRFLSKYFLKKDEELIHGAQIYSAYLNEHDEQFVNQIEKEKLSKEWLTFQFTLKAIHASFPHDADAICNDWVKMLIFDAFTGNNDRHFYNWGVIDNIKYSKSPVFAPIYDSARGLFWNYDENAIRNKLYLHKGEINETHLKTYVKKSEPKLGWEGMRKANHFQIFEKIFSEYPIYRDTCLSIVNPMNYRRVIELIEKDFSTLFSKLRLKAIIACLDIRFHELNSICLQRGDKNYI